MQYLLLLYRDEQWRESLTDDEGAAVEREYAALLDELTGRGAYVAAAPLRPTETATTVRVRDEETLVTDGPFAETKEQLGGFVLIDVGSVEEARSWAARLPAARHGSVEVRPLMPVGARMEAG
jgi:hypothetical protein